MYMEQTHVGGNPGRRKRTRTLRSDRVRENVNLPAAWCWPHGEGSRFTEASQMRVL